MTVTIKAVGWRYPRGRFRAHFPLGRDDLFSLQQDALGILTRDDKDCLKLGKDNVTRLDTNVADCDGDLLGYHLPAADTIER